MTCEICKEAKPVMKLIFGKFHVCTECQQNRSEEVEKLYYSPPEPKPAPGPRPVKASKGIKIAEDMLIDIQCPQCGNRLLIPKNPLWAINIIGGVQGQCKKCGLLQNSKGIWSQV